MSVSPCIFCRIGTHDIPASIVYEDEMIIAFLDMKPVNKGHVLVVPKKHTDHFLQADKETLHLLADVVRDITPAILQEVGADGFNLHVNTGAAAGQVIFHLHWHIIPRFEGDGKRMWPHDADYQEGEMDALASKIRIALEATMV